VEYSHDIFPTIKRDMEKTATPLGAVQPSSSWVYRTPKSCEIDQNMFPLASREKTSKVWVCLKGYS